jgi:hypothetical protein
VAASAVGTTMARWQAGQRMLFPARLSATDNFLRQRGQRIFISSLSHGTVVGHETRSAKTRPELERVRGDNIPEMA